MTTPNNAALIGTQRRPKGTWLPTSMILAVLAASAVATGCSGGAASPSSASPVATRPALPTTTTIDPWKYRPTSTVPAPTTTDPQAESSFTPTPDPNVTVAPVVPGQLAPVPADNATEPWQFIGQLYAPVIGMSVPVHEGITLGLLAKGPGHWPGSAEIGEPGNAILVGHRVSHTQPFLRIDKLVEGDILEFQSTKGGNLTKFKVVFSAAVTDPDSDEGFAEITLPNATKPTLTLDACHPLGKTTQRWVVHAELVTP